MKLVGCGLLDTKKMRIGAAGLYESLKGLRAGKLKTKVLHAPVRFREALHT